MNGLRYGPLSADDVGRVHEAALAALEARGLPVQGEAVFQMLEEAGARVDRAAGRAWLSAGLVNGAVAQAPASFVVAGRTPDRDARFGGGPGGLLAATAATTDIGATCTLADALAEIVAIGLPTPRLAGLPVVVAHTAKPVLVCGSLDAVHAAVAVQAARWLTCDGESDRESDGSPDTADDAAQELPSDRRYPPLGVVVHSAEQTDLGPLLACARGGLACAWLSQPILDPADAASTGLVAGVTAFHAAALAACALQQLAAPASAFAVPALPAAIELHAPALGSGAAYAAAFGAVAQLAAHAGLPVTSGFPLTRTAADEWSAAAEAALALQAAALGGAALVAGAGHTDRGTVYSPAQLVLDAETWSNVAAVAAGIEVDDDSIALDTIAAIGIGGNALAQKHTRRHMKDVWRPRLFDRTAYDVWDREGRLGAHERAAALAGDLVAGHEVPPLDAEKAATLRRIIEAAGL